MMTSVPSCIFGDKYFMKGGVKFADRARREQILQEIERLLTGNVAAASYVLIYVRQIQKNPKKQRIDVQFSSPIMIARKITAAQE